MIAASSRQNDSERIFPGLVRLEKRSIEMKPSIFSSSGRSAAARSRYSCWRPAAGSTSKITANMNYLIQSATEDTEVTEEKQNPNEKRDSAFVHFSVTSVAKVFGLVYLRS